MIIDTIFQYERVISIIDAMLNAQIQCIIEHPTYSCLAGRWAGMALVLPYSNINLLNLTEKEYQIDKKNNLNHEHSHLFDLLYHQQLDQAGGRPWSLLLWDNDQELSANDLHYLNAIATTSLAPIALMASIAQQHQLHFLFPVSNQFVCDNQYFCSSCFIIALFCCESLHNLQWPQLSGAINLLKLSATAQSHHLRVKHYHPSTKALCVNQHRHKPLLHLENYHNLQNFIIACRFGHYIKLLCREKIGTFISIKACEEYLYHWLLKYCSHSPNDPLRQAHVNIYASKNRAGIFMCKITLELHDNEAPQLRQTIALINEISLAIH